MENKLVCIVLGGSTNAIGQIRAIHQLGYKCINIVENSVHSWSTKSRYCKGYIAPHPFLEREKAVDFLTKIIKRQSTKPFIFFASDDWMDMVGENEEYFRNIAIIPQSPWREMSKFYNKKFLYRIAEEYNIPYPKTLEIEHLNAINDTIDYLNPPFIVKPQTTVSQNLINQCGIKTYHRTQKFETKKELLEWIKLLLDNNIDFPVLIQEFIPGDATSLYTLTSYSDVNGNLIAGSVGHKLRQFPPVAGRITSGVLEHNEQLYQIGKQFLKAIKYHGLANTEFKYDSRDGKFKLMEINTRLGAWNYSALFAGLNLINVAIADTLGFKYDGPITSTEKDGKIWYNLIYDMGSSLYLNRKFEGGKFKMSYSNWRKTLKGKSFEAVWSIKDPLPFLFNLLYTINGFLHK